MDREYLLPLATSLGDLDLGSASEDWPTFQRTLGGRPGDHAPPAWFCANGQGFIAEDARATSRRGRCVRSLPRRATARPRFIGFQKPCGPRACLSERRLHRRPRERASRPQVRVGFNIILAISPGRVIRRYSSVPETCDKARPAILPPQRRRRCRLIVFRTIRIVSSCMMST